MKILRRMSETFFSLHTTVSLVYRLRGTVNQELLDALANEENQ
jgi:hypothetical protein